MLLSHLSIRSQTTINKCEDNRQFQKKTQTEAKIIHFTSSCKPWHIGINKEALITNYHFQNERSIYFRYVKKNRWFYPLQADLWILVRKLIVFFGKKVPVQVQSILNTIVG